MKTMVHPYDLVEMAATGAEPIVPTQYFATKDDNESEYDCAGTFGSAGTFGGTFGSIGSWGCCC